MEQRNKSALQHLAELVDSVPGIAPIITKQLYEKGLQMPPPTSSTTPQQTGTLSRNRSRASMRSGGVESHQSGRMDSDRDEELLSRSKIIAISTKKMNSNFLLILLQCRFEHLPAQHRPVFRSHHQQCHRNQQKVVLILAHPW